MLSELVSIITLPSSPTAKSAWCINLPNSTSLLDATIHTSSKSSSLTSVAMSFNSLTIYLHIVLRVSFILILSVSSSAIVLHNACAKIVAVVVPSPDLLCAS